MPSDGVRGMNRRPWVALAFVAVTLVVFGSVTGAVLAHRSAPHARAAAPSPAQALSISCRSPSLGGTMPTRVYLPSGYASGARYAVIYFLQGLPAGSSSSQQDACGAAALASGGETAIVVASQCARDASSDREYLD